MRWLKPNVRNSLYSLIGSVVGQAPAASEHDMDEVREAMLGALGASASRDHPSLCRRIRYAGDIETLWYLRGELMQALSARHGERAAGKQLAEISALFEDLLPHTMHSRPSPLR